MIVRPAIDLRDGQCVQLVGGDYENEIVRLPDPVAVAQDWIEKGFNNLHIIDLDRATGRGSNISTVKALCDLANNSDYLDVRVGGGIRSESDIEEILKAGASKVVIGTKAIREPQWFTDLVTKFPGQLYIALEVDQRQVRVAGWQEDSEKSLEELISEFNDLDVAGIFVTAIHLEGRRQGTDLELFSHIRSLTDHEIVASGGVTTISDVEALEQAKISEVVLGAAIYKDPDLAHDLAEWLQERKDN